MIPGQPQQMVPGMIPPQMMMAPGMVAPQMMMGGPMMIPNQMAYPGMMVRPAYPAGPYPQQNNFAYQLTEQFNQLNMGGQNRNQGGNRATRQQIREAQNQYPSLKVQGLPTQNFLDLDFEKFFQSRGYAVKKAKVVLHNRTLRSLGYGYLQFHTKEEMERCLREMNNVVLNGQALSMVVSQFKPEYDKDANVHVQSIEKSVTQ